VKPRSVRAALTVLSLVAPPGSALADCKLFQVAELPARWMDCDPWSPSRSTGSMLCLWPTAALSYSIMSPPALRSTS